MAKILCTISPMNNQLKGMDMARINGAFGTREEIINLIRSVNVPVILDIPRGRTKPKTTDLSDEELIKLAIKEGLKYIGISYVKSATDIFEVRNVASPHSVKLISKIETKEAIENIDQIISASDGVMIDRGDLANAIGIEKLPRNQKRIIRKCNLVGKPVIVATEMLMSMVENSGLRPARGHNVPGIHGTLLAFACPGPDRKRLFGSPCGQFPNQPRKSEYFSIGSRGRH